MKQSNALTEVNINKIEEKNKVDIVNSFITNTLPQKNITFDDDEPIINEEHELNLDIDADLSD
jgi:phosphotransferase system IIA component